MAKTLNIQQTNTNQGEDKKKRKKQAKLEAKMMLEMEEARKEVQKAEQKFSKAQSNLEASRNRLRELEEGLAKIRGKITKQPESSVAAAPVEQSYAHPEEIGVPDQGESYTDGEAIEELHQSSLPPVEGRSDILTDSGHNTPTTPTSEGETSQSTPGLEAEGSPQ